MDGPKSPIIAVPFTMLRSSSPTRGSSSNVCLEGLPLLSAPSFPDQQQRSTALRYLMAMPQASCQTPSGLRGDQKSRPAPPVAAATRKRKGHGLGAKAADTKAAPQRHGLHGQPATGSAPQKTAYAQQKELRRDLEEEARELEERVEMLRLQAGLPTKADKQEIIDIRDRNAGIRENIYSARQYVLRLQTMIQEKLQQPPVNPLSTYIHLPCDQAQRRAILQGMKHVKLRRAAEVAIDRFRHLDTNDSYLSEERFTTDDGAYHCDRLEMNTFPNFRSAKQLYDALLFWIYNMEISVTEMVDQIAVREDSEDIEPTIWNHRIVAQSEDIGCVEELNIVGFAQFYKSYDLLGGAPLGVIANDTVNVDDLYPYKPTERTRKDFQVSHIVCEILDPDTQRKRVVVKSFYLNAQLAPQFPVEPRVVEKLHEYMSRWCELKVKYLREYGVPLGA